MVKKRELWNRLVRIAYRVDIDSWWLSQWTYMSRLWLNVFTHWFVIHWVSLVWLNRSCFSPWRMDTLIMVINSFWIHHGHISVQLIIHLKCYPSLEIACSISWLWHCTLGQNRISVYVHMIVFTRFKFGRFPSHWFSQWWIVFLHIWVWSHFIDKIVLILIE